jgi:hypothetical protein
VDYYNEFDPFEVRFPWQAKLFMRLMMFLVWVWRVTGFCIEPDLVAAFEQLALRVLTSTAITRVSTK